MRGVERLDFLAQDVEILPALAHRLHLRGGAFHQVVHLAEALMQRIESQLFLRQVVCLGEQGLEPFRQAVRLVRELDDVLVPGGERGHAGFGVDHRALQRADARVARVQLLFSHRE